MGKIPGVTIVQKRPIDMSNIYDPKIGVRTVLVKDCNVGGCSVSGFLSGNGITLNESEEFLMTFQLNYPDYDPSETVGLFTALNANPKRKVVMERLFARIYMSAFEVGASYGSRAVLKDNMEALKRDLLGGK